MAGYGPPPAEQKRHRMPDRYEDFKTTVNPDDPIIAPPLPGRWPAVVKRWYEVWCSAPQARAFLPTDWQRLHMLAPLVARYYRSPDKAVLAEIRLNESLLGATHADRLRARIKVESERPAEPTAADEVSAQRRKRLLDAS